MPGRALFHSLLTSNYLRNREDCYSSSEMRKLRCGELERVIQSRGSPTRGNFNPRGHRAILETFLVIADWGGGALNILPCTERPPLPQQRIFQAQMSKAPRLRNWSNPRKGPCILIPELKGCICRPMPSKRGRVVTGSLLPFLSSTLENSY